MKTIYYKDWEGVARKAETVDLDGKIAVREVIDHFDLKGRVSKSYGEITLIDKEDVIPGVNNE